MKITDILISIPPYISTTWDNVISLHTQDNNLVINLRNSSPVTIPDLSGTVIEQIFQAHTLYLETHQRPQKPIKNSSIEQIFTLPIKLNMQKIDIHKEDLLNSVLQHDPKNKDLPPIPEEMADKLGMLSGIMNEQDLMAMPPSEPDCNCMYCQIHRILMKKIVPTEHSSTQHTIEHTDSEPISDSDLHFQEWDIKQIKDQLYTVTNKLDPHEQYTVFLGDPIGCTCGKTNCEHIIAVLRS